MQLSYIMGALSRSSFFSLLASALQQQLCVGAKHILARDFSISTSVSLISFWAFSLAIYRKCGFSASILGIIWNLFQGVVEEEGSSGKGGLGCRERTSNKHKCLCPFPGSCGQFACLGLKNTFLVGFATFWALSFSIIQDRVLSRSLEIKHGMMDAGLDLESK